jgi:hypothetical protein
MNKTSEKVLEYNGIYGALTLFTGMITWVK